MCTYFIPVFAQKFGATFVDLGIIGTVWALATAVTPMFAGYLADKTNRAWIFAISLIINTVATVLLVFSHSVVQIVVFRLFAGFGMGFFWPTAEMLVTDLAHANKRVKEMGRYSIVLALGPLIGPLIGGLVIERLGYVVLFSIASVIIGISFIQVVLCVLPAYRKKAVTIVQHSSGNFRTVRKLSHCYAMLLCYGIVTGVVSSILPGYANAIGISVGYIGFLFSALSVAKIFSYANSDRYLKFGEKRTLLLASLTMSAGIFIIAVFPSFIAFFFGLILIGGSMGAVFPIANSLISRHFPHQLGAAMGSYETVVNFGNAVGPYIAGVLASLMSIESSFMMMSVFGVLMILFATNRRTYSNTSRPVVDCSAAA
jgi:MFS family permease